MTTSKKSYFERSENQGSRRRRGSYKTKIHRFPVFVEKDKDGFYIAECSVFEGCYTQGKTLDEALKNIREVIEICLEKKEAKERMGGCYLAISIY